jgi:hypothetical protein
MQRRCEHCGVEFEARPADVAKGFGRFCSRKCGQARRCKSGRDSAGRYFDKRDGRWYRKWREAGSRKVHSQLESRWVWEQVNGPIPDGCEIHHRDHDRTNNDIANLECVTAGWHDDYHQRLREDHVVIDGVEHRRCQRCGEYKPTDLFTRRQAGTYHGYCRPCSVVSVREWRRSNADRVRSYRREWNSVPRYERVCEFCGTSFLAKRTTQRFCSRSCASKNQFTYK